MVNNTRTILAETQFLADLSERIRLADDAAELVEGVAQAIGEHLQVKRCLFIEIDVAHDRATVLADYGPGLPSATVEYKISNYSPVTQVEIEAGRAIINNDSQTDPRTAAVYEITYQPQGERAYVAVPLMREGQWTGVL